MAAENGVAHCQYSLGWAYLKGDQVPKDAQAGIGWLEEAARQNHLDALCDLGEIYEDGTYVRQDLDAALRFYKAACVFDGLRGEEAEGLINAWERAADLGHAQAQYLLGRAWLEDWTARDGNKFYEEAEKWLRLASGQGHLAATRKLASMYFKGLGVAQDYHAAFNFYKPAAQEGDPESQAFVGWMYAAGAGVGKDLTEAKKWYMLAARSAQFSEYANKRLEELNG